MTTEQNERLRRYAQYSDAQRNVFDAWFEKNHCAQEIAKHGPELYMAFWELSYEAYLCGCAAGVQLLKRFPDIHLKDTP